LDVGEGGYRKTSRGCLDIGARGGIKNKSQARLGEHVQKEEPIYTEAGTPCYTYVADVDIDKKTT
jgi:hypothetical protein